MEVLQYQNPEPLETAIQGRLSFITVSVFNMVPLITYFRPVTTDIAMVAEFPKTGSVHKANGKKKETE